MFVFFSINKQETAEPRFVPHGLELDKQIFKTEALSDKNKVIREFVANIFNNHITEALKVDMKYHFVFNVCFPMLEAKYNPTRS